MLIVRNWDLKPKKNKFNVQLWLNGYFFLQIFGYFSNQVFRVFNILKDFSLKHRSDRFFLCAKNHFKSD